MVAMTTRAGALGAAHIRREACSAATTAAREGAHSAVCRPLEGCFIAPGATAHHRLGAGAGPLSLVVD